MSQLRIVSEINLRYAVAYNNQFSKLLVLADIDRRQVVI